MPPLTKHSLTVNDVLMDSVYEQVRPLIYKTVAVFWRSHDNACFDEMMAEARLVFVQSYREYNPETSRFSTWLVFRLNKHFLQSRRKYRRSLRTASLCKDELVGPRERKSTQRIDWEDFMGKLPPDSRTLVDLCVNTPLEMIEEVRAWGNPTPLNVHIHARRHLRRLGWTKGRIQRAFRKAREVLKAEVSE